MTDRMNDDTRSLHTVGLDVGDKYTHFYELDADGGAVDDGRFRTTKSALGRRFKSTDSMLVVLETGTHSRWMAELLSALGHVVLVANARELRLIYANKFKDDRLDAERLARLGRFDPSLLKPVSVRRPDSATALTLVRSRAGLVDSRTKLINMVRGQLKSHGVRVPKGLSTTTLCQWVVEHTGSLAAVFEPTLEALSCLDRQVRTLDKRMEPALEGYAPDAVHLTEIAGVGALTVLTFVALVEDPKRFKKARDVGAFLGLVRRRNDSGFHKSQLGITKAGDPYMRRLLVNCAHYILGPFGPDCDLRRWGTALAGRANKQVAAVGLARKLAVLLLRMWRDGIVYDPFHTSAETGVVSVVAAA